MTRQQIDEERWKVLARSAVNGILLSIDNATLAPMPKEVAKDVLEEIVSGCESRIEALKEEMGEDDGH